MSNLKKGTINTVWLFSERIMTMVVTMLISVLLARYLSKSDFGQLNYLISLLSIIAPFSALGLNALVTRELVRGDVQQGVILGTSLFLRFIGGVSAVVILILILSLDYKLAISNNWLYLASIANVFTALNVLDYFFQSVTKSKYIVRCRLLLITFSTSIKILLIYIELDIKYFMMVILLEPVLLSFLFFISYKIYDQNLNKWRIDFIYAKQLIQQSKWLIMSGFMAVLYLKIDQLMLGQMASMEAVATYSVAVRLSEVWYFFPVAFVSSFFPMLLKSRINTNQYIQQQQNLCDVLFIASLILSIFITLFGTEIVVILYGELYADSSLILKIHIWASIFIFMRALLSKWLIAEGMLKYSLFTHSIAGVVNIGLNFYLIPIYEGVGAAIATLISYALASYIVLWFAKSTRPMAVVMTKSLFLISLLNIIRVKIIK